MAFSPAPLMNGEQSDWVVYGTMAQVRGAMYLGGLPCSSFLFLLLWKTRTGTLNSVGGLCLLHPKSTAAGRRPHTYASVSEGGWWCTQAPFLANLKDLWMGLQHLMEHATSVRFGGIRLEVHSTIRHLKVSSFFFFFFWKHTLSLKDQFPFPSHFIILLFGAWT